MLMVTLVWALASARGNIGVDSSMKASPSDTHTVLRKASSLTSKFIAPEKKWDFERPLQPQALAFEHGRYHVIVNRLSEGGKP